MYIACAKFTPSNFSFSIQFLRQSIESIQFLPLLSDNDNNKKKNKKK